MNRAKAELVVEALTNHFKTKFNETPEFFLADHNHEELTPGAWSIAYEGWWGENPWTYEVTMYGPIEGLPEGVFLEPVASWCLGVYDA